MQPLDSADDLRTFLFVAQTGRVSHAAQLLGIDHTTVGRRIAALERQAGARLFNRTRGNWSLTADGERLLDPAERIEAAMTSAREVAAGNGPAALSGSVRILSPDGFGAFLLAPALGELTRQHPDLVVELITETQHLGGATVRDFDIAITLDQPNSAGLVHRRLAPYILQLFATPEYLESSPPVRSIADLERHAVIWYVDRLLDMEPLRVLHELRASPANIQTMNIVAHWQAAAAGVCIAPLPSYIGRADSRLVCVLPDFRVRRTYWVSARREHASGARVRTLISFLDRIVAERAADMVPESHPM
jgi:DNA-binding transcriptional LysR family regulator